MMTAETKKLERSNDDRWLAGVCGGLGQYFGIDSTIVRILFVLLTVFVGGGILIYIILWIVMPEAESGAGNIDISDSEMPEKEPSEDEDAADETE